MTYVGYTDNIERRIEEHNSTQSGKRLLDTIDDDHGRILHKKNHRIKREADEDVKNGINPEYEEGKFYCIYV
jgi:predicted GIY-YIG superfamily endonuclease